MVHSKTIAETVFCVKHEVPIVKVHLLGIRETVNGLPMGSPQLSFAWPEAETLPNALMPSDFTVDVAAGDGGIGDDASSIDPNITTMPFEKCF